MNILKNFRLDPWVVRTLIALQRACKQPNEKQTIVAVINEAAAQKGLVFKPCPDAKSTRKDEEGMMIECGKKNSWLLFDPNCLECDSWQPTPTPAPTPASGAQGGG